MDRIHFWNYWAGPYQGLNWQQDAIGKAFRRAILSMTQGATGWTTPLSECIAVVHDAGTAYTIEVSRSTTLVMPSGYIIVIPTGTFTYNTAANSSAFVSLHKIPVNVTTFNQLHSVDGATTAAYYKAPLAPLYTSVCAGYSGSSGEVWPYLSTDWTYAPAIASAASITTPYEKNSLSFLTPATYIDLMSDARFLFSTDSAGEITAGPGSGYQLILGAASSTPSASYLPAFAAGDLSFFTNSSTSIQKYLADNVINHNKVWEITGTNGLALLIPEGGILFTHNSDYTNSALSAKHFHYVGSWLPSALLITSSMNTPSGLLHYVYPSGDGFIGFKWSLSASEGSGTIYGYTYDPLIYTWSTIGSAIYDNVTGSAYPVIIWTSANPYKVGVLLDEDFGSAHYSLVWTANITASSGIAGGTVSGHQGGQSNIVIDPVCGVYLIGGNLINQYDSLTSGDRTAISRSNLSMGSFSWSRAATITGVGNIAAAAQVNEGNRSGNAKFFIATSPSRTSVLSGIASAVSGRITSGINNNLYYDNGIIINVNAPTYLIIGNINSVNNIVYQSSFASWKQYLFCVGGVSNNIDQNELLIYDTNQNIWFKSGIILPGISSSTFESITESLTMTEVLTDGASPSISGAPTILDAISDSSDSSFIYWDSADSQTPYFISACFNANKFKHKWVYGTISVSARLSRTGGTSYPYYLRGTHLTSATGFITSSSFVNKTISGMFSAGDLVDHDIYYVQLQLNLRPGAGYYEKLARIYAEITYKDIKNQCGLAINGNKLLITRDDGFLCTIDLSEPLICYMKKYLL